MGARSAPGVPVPRGSWISAAGHRHPQPSSRRVCPRGRLRPGGSRLCYPAVRTTTKKVFFSSWRIILEYYYTISIKKKRWLCLTSSATSGTSSAARCPVFPGAQAPHEGSRDLRAQAGALRGASNPPGSPSLGRSSRRVTPRPANHKGGFSQNAPALAPAAP